jgi:excisionase family DNA binding protein
MEIPPHPTATEPRISRPGVPDRHLYRIPEAMHLLSMSRSVIYELIRSGRLRTVRQGRSRLVPKVAIVEYVHLLIRESEGVEYDEAS